MSREGIFIVSSLFFSTALSVWLKAEEYHKGWITEIQTSASPQEQTSLSVISEASEPIVKSHALDGIASYYWQDLYTASGEIFDKRAMTAAHPTLPFGTIVEVTNLGNGRSARVRINDRGPFVQGRVIDVSEAAAEVLDMRNRGLAPVRLNIVTASAEAR